MKIFSVILFLFSPVSFAAISILTTRPSSSFIKAKLSADIQTGSTNNAAKIDDGAGSPYYQVNPELVLNWHAFEHLIFEATAKGGFKKFLNYVVDKQAGETRIDGIINVSLFFNDRWELGLNGKTVQSNTHSPVVLGTTIDSIGQEYLSYGGSGHMAWHLPKLAVRLGSSYTIQNYSTSIYDIRGNTFKDSFNEQEIFLSSAAHFWRPVVVSINSSVGQRVYTERMAEYTSGLPIEPGFKHPKLYLLFHQHHLITNLSLFGMDSETDLGVRFNIDQVFGAQNSRIFSIRENMKIPLFWKLEFRPTLLYSIENYSKFVSNPLASSVITPLRQDYVIESRILFAVPILKYVEAQFSYRYNDRTTNYLPADFEEHALEVGLNAQY